MFSRQHSLEILGPTAVGYKLADHLIALTLDKQFEVVFLCKVYPACLICVVHVNENFWALSIHLRWQSIEWLHS